MLGLYATVLACEYVPVRDLGAKMFTTLVRKLKKKQFQTHVSRTINALVRAWRNGKSTESEFVFDFSANPLPEVEGSQDEDATALDVYSEHFQDVEAACDGLARLVFYSCKGVKGCLHSFGGEKLSALLSLLVQPDTTTTPKDDTHSQAHNSELAFITGKIASECMRRSFRHLHVTNMAELWIRLSVALDPLIAHWKAVAQTIASSAPTPGDSLSIATYMLVEMLIFGFTFSKGRGLSDVSVRNTVSDIVVSKVTELVIAYGTYHQSSSFKNNFDKSHLSDRMVCLFIRVWIVFPRATKLLSCLQESNILSLVLGINSVASPATLVSTQLIASLPKDLVKSYVMKPLLNSIAVDLRIDSSLVDSVDVLMGLCDFRLTGDNTASLYETQALLAGSEAILTSLTIRCLEIIERVNSFKNLVKLDQNELLRALLIVKWMYGVLPKQTSEAVVNRPQSFQKHIYRLISKNLLPQSAEPISRAFSAHLASVYCLVSNDYEKIAKHMSTLFFDSPTSLSYVWAFVSVLDSFYSFQLKRDAQFEKEKVLASFLDSSQVELVIELAGVHLRTSSHWLRMGILRLLQFCPRVELIDSTHKTAKDSNKKESIKTIADRADVVMTCTEICLLALQVSVEREVTAKLSNLEVIVRSGRLPTAYLKVISSFCVGLLSVKFATIWPAATAVVRAVAATDDGEDIVWPIVLGALHSIQKDYARTESLILDGSDWIEALVQIDDGVVAVPPALARQPYFHCLYSDNSPMRPLQDEDSSGSAKVEVDSRTDSETLYGLVWKVLELCPNITLKRSKVVVPMFLR